MKKRMMAVILLLTLVLSLVPGVDARADEIEPVLNETKITLETGNKFRLTVGGATGKFGWTSSDPEVAKVTKYGKVIAVSEGKATITAAVNDKKLKCKVKVVDVKYVTIMAVGDNLFHQRMIDQGLQSGGSFDYSRIYAELKDTIEAADVRIINQETILTSDRSLWAGYPNFGTPLEVGDAVVGAGFNVITTATNHSYDKGTAGMKSTVKYWKKQAKKGVLMTGMYDSQEAYDTITVGEYNGIRIAFLNYTYSLNGRSLDSSNSYMVKLLNENLIKKEIAEAKKQADVVIVLPHWGTEYLLEADSGQKALAQKMADWGADIIIGTHPHVLEPMVTLTSKDGRKVPCYYSLGNFTANMPNKNCHLEGMAELKLKMAGGKVEIVSYKLTPLVNHISRGDSEWIVYRLEDYTEELAKNHLGNNSAYNCNITVESMWKLYTQITGFKKEDLN